MEKVLKWIGDLAPFLGAYPAFVKLIFAAWIAVGAALFISLVLARPTFAPQAGGTGKSADRKDIWMVIEGLEFFSARKGAQVRVLANVNGTEFIYPSRSGVEWLEVGPSMSPQIFHLPEASERYIIRFEASVRVPGTDREPEVKGQLTSVKEDIINIPQDIPFTGRYVLHTFDPVHLARSAGANAELRYRITDKPN